MRTPALVHLGVTSNCELLKAYIIHHAQEWGTIVYSTNCLQSLIDLKNKIRPNIIICDYDCLLSEESLDLCNFCNDNEIKLIIVSKVKTYEVYDFVYQLGASNVVFYPYEDKLPALMKKLIIQKPMTKKLIQVTNSFHECHISEDEILFAEKVSKRMVNIQLTNGTYIQSTTTLMNISYQCSNVIFSPHRSFLVNTSHISSIFTDLYIQGNYEVRLSLTERMIPMSRRGYRDYCSKYLS